MSTSCRCGATWTGLRIEHCAACHETFTGTSSGDRHRVGDHAVSAGPDRRRCLTPDEMRAKGMTQNARGQWGNGGTSPWARGGANSDAVDPESTEGLQGAPSDDRGRWMTHWQPIGTPLPAYVEHATEDEANLFALRKSREIGGEVAVVRVGEGA